MKTSTVALAAFLFAIGCGRVVSVDDTVDGPFTEKDAGTTDATPDVTDLPDVVTTQNEGGACAVYKPGFDAVANGGHVAGGPAGCQVAIGVHDEGGSPTNDIAKSSVGTASLTGQTLRLSCGDAGNLIMIATIDCYKGPGTYDVPAGALFLGGKASDRRCRLDADTTEGQLRGFISCDKDPADPTNVFSNTTAPIGLGVYALPYP